jgi:hypothetical protein
MAVISQRLMARCKQVPSGPKYGAAGLLPGIARTASPSLSGRYEVDRATIFPCTSFETKAVGHGSGQYFSLGWLLGRFSSSRG